MRQHTGQVIGGVSPIGHPVPVATYIDPWLRRYDVVWAAAGHPAAVFSTTYTELVAMTGAVETDGRLTSETARRAARSTFLELGRWTSPTRSSETGCATTSAGCCGAA